MGALTGKAREAGTAIGTPYSLPDLPPLGERRISSLTTIGLHKHYAH